MKNAYFESHCEPFEVPHDNPDKRVTLLSHIWLPEGEVKGIFLGIHGGMAHAGDWVTPALYFKKKGIATFALDLRWHGTYPQYNQGGKVLFHIQSYDQYVNDIHHYYLDIQQRYPNVPIYILSHSNGSLIALLYGLGVGRATAIKGFIVSSPWIKNKVEVPKIVLKFLGVIAAIAPRLAVKPESLTDKLTHDPEITARHHADESIGLRGTKATVRVGMESQRAQAWLLEHIHEWARYPIFAVLAGQDYLADFRTSEATLRKIPPKLLTLKIYEENYHENFNELNREEIYEEILTWVKALDGRSNLGT